MTTDKRIEEVKEKVSNMPYMEISYINAAQVGIICTYACIRSERLEEIKDFLGLSDIWVTWCPSKKIEGMLIEGKF